MKWLLNTYITSTRKHDFLRLAFTWISHFPFSTTPNTFI